MWFVFCHKCGKYRLLVLLSFPGGLKNTWKPFSFVAGGNEMWRSSTMWQFPGFTYLIMSQTAGSLLNREQRRWQTETHGLLKNTVKKSDVPGNTVCPCRCSASKSCFCSIQIFSVPCGKQYSCQTGSSGLVEVNPTELFLSTFEKRTRGRIPFVSFTPTSICYLILLICHWQHCLYHTHLQSSVSALPTGRKHHTYLTDGACVCVCAKESLV